jgi:hypothetical protein
MIEIIDNQKIEFIEPLREFSSSIDKRTGKRYEI